MSQYTRYIQGTSDDVTYFVSDTGFNDSTILIGDDYVVCLRFTNVTIPRGVTITSAYLRGKSEENNTDDVYLKIYGIDEDNTADFSSTQIGRAKTTAAIDWDMTSVTEDTTYTSPDIKNIVQEIIDRDGWASGNAMGFYIEDDGSAIYNYYIFYDYEDGQSNSFYLEINYTTSTATTTATSSTTSTSTTSYSTTTKVPSNWGLKVSKSGYDVKEVEDLKNYIFTSARGVLGLRQLSTYSGITDASGNISITKAHNFGYVPITIVSYKTISTSAPNSITVGKEVLLPVTWHSFYQNQSKEVIEVTETADFSIDATNIYITLHSEYFNHDTFDSGDMVGINYTFKVYYYFNEISEE